MQLQLFFHALLPTCCAARSTAGRAVLRGELVELLYLGLHLGHPVLAGRHAGSDGRWRRRLREVEQVRLPSQGRWADVCCVSGRVQAGAGQPDSAAKVGTAQGAPGWLELQA